jgi:ABC-type phosphate transport system substrate-binding protein
MGSREAGRLPEWLDTPEKLNVFVKTLQDTGSYTKAGESVGKNKNAVSGAVKRAGGLVGFLERAGIEKPADAAAQIRMKIPTGTYASRGLTKTQTPRVKPAPRASYVSEGRQKSIERRNEVAQRFVAQAEARIDKKGSDPRVAAVASALQSKGYTSIPGVSIDRGRALVKGPNVDPKNPEMQTYARIKLDRSSPDVPQNDLLAASLKRDLESGQSAIVTAAKKSGIQRIAVTIHTDRGHMPVIDRKL